MKKLLKVSAALSLLHAILMIASCTDEPDCGGFSIQYRVSDIYLDERKVLDSENLFNTTAVPTSESTTFDSLLLVVVSETDGVALQQEKPDRPGSFMSAAYACSPLPPSESLDTVSSIEIYSIIETAPNVFEDQEDMTASFDITTFNYDADFSTRVSLTQYNQTTNPGSNEYYFQLNEAPSEEANIGFRVVINYSTRSTLEASSRILYISP